MNADSAAFVAEKYKDIIVGIIDRSLRGQRLGIRLTKHWMQAKIKYAIVC